MREDLGVNKILEWLELEFEYAKRAADNLDIEHSEERAYFDGRRDLAEKAISRIKHTMKYESHTGDQIDTWEHEEP